MKIDINFDKITGWIILLGILYMSILSSKEDFIKIGAFGGISFLLLLAIELITNKKQKGGKK